MATTSATNEINPDSEQTQVLQIGSTLHSSSNFVSRPKLSIKLDDTIFLLWNQKVEGVILTHNLHRLLVNSQVPQKYNSSDDEKLNKVSPEYAKWIVQDQALYTWLLSTVSDTILPSVFSCKHATFYSISIQSQCCHCTILLISALAEIDSCSSLSAAAVTSSLGSTSSSTTVSVP